MLNAYQTNTGGANVNPNFKPGGLPPKIAIGDQLHYLKCHFAMERATEQCSTAEKPKENPNTDQKDADNIYDKHAATNKAQLEKAVFPTTAEFTLCGTPKSLEKLDPIQNGIWSTTYSREARDALPSSPWRSLYDPKGPMAHYMQPKSNDVTSGVVALGGQVLSAKNNGPFTVGVFAIGAKVSRSPSHQLYENRVQEIIKKYKAAMTNMADHSQEISLIKILEPYTTETMENTCFFLDEDMVSTNHSQQNESTSHSKHLKYLHCKEKDVMESILSEKRINNPDGTQVEMMILQLDSPLLNFIKENAFKCSKIAGVELQIEEDPETGRKTLASNFPIWRDELKWTLTPELMASRKIPQSEGSKIVFYTPIIKKMVDVGIKLLLEEIKRCPLENLNKQQFYVARLDANKWTESSAEVPDVNNRLDELIRVNFSINYIYQVTTQNI